MSFSTAISSTGLNSNRNLLFHHTLEFTKAVILSVQLTGIFTSFFDSAYQPIYTRPEHPTMTEQPGASIEFITDHWDSLATTTFVIISILSIVIVWMQVRWLQKLHRQRRHETRSGKLACDRPSHYPPGMQFDKWLESKRY